jgi:hypothetical protein
VRPQLARHFPALLAVTLLVCAGACGDSTPPMTHGSPNESARQMCVICHTCGFDGTAIRTAPVIDQTHDVCNSCHAPDGGVIHHSGDSCEWKMDCNANPPTINCDECHTVEYVNDLCEECH